MFGPISALDELEDDEDFATAGTDDRTQGVGDAMGIKAMEVCPHRFFSNCYSIFMRTTRHRSRLHKLPLVCPIEV